MKKTVLFAKPSTTTIEMCDLDRKPGENGDSPLSSAVSMTPDRVEDLAGRMSAQMDKCFRHEMSRLTIKGMQENARQGYYNSSKPPFGFALEEVAVAEPGRRKNRKRLVAAEEESAVVCRIFSMNKEGVGAKELAAELNREGVLRRGKAWSTPKITQILESPIYDSSKKGMEE